MPQSKKNTDQKVPLSRYLVFFPLAILGCWLDLWSKSTVFEQVGWPEGEYWLVTDFLGIKFGLQTTVNYGALFGLGQGYTKLFALFSVIAAIGICYWLFVKRAAHDWLLTCALGGVMAGIFGNLYDRLGIWGTAAVRDWIAIQYLMSPEPYRWPNFNIADCFLVCGAILLMLHAFWTQPEEEIDQESIKNEQTN